MFSAIILMVIHDNILFSFIIVISPTVLYIYSDCTIIEHQNVCVKKNECVNIVLKLFQFFFFYKCKYFLQEIKQSNFYFVM